MPRPQPRRQGYAAGIDRDVAADRFDKTVAGDEERPVKLGERLDILLQLGVGDDACLRGVAFKGVQDDLA